MPYLSNAINKMAGVAVLDGPGAIGLDQAAYSGTDTATVNGGENLAGAPDVNFAHVNLMNSPGHRENILRPEFTHVGIGVVEGSQYGKIFTQQFIRK